MLQTGQVALVRRFRLVGYLILGMALVIPALDTIANLWPPQLASLTWRYGTVAILANALSSPLLVLFLFLMFATIVDDRNVIIVIVVLALLAGPASFTGLAALLLDHIQLRARLAVENIPKLDLATGITALKLLVNGLLYLLLAFSAFRTRRALMTAAESRVNVQGPYFVKNVGPKSDDAQG